MTLRKVERALPSAPPVSASVKNIVLSEHPPLSITAPFIIPPSRSNAPLNLQFTEHINKLKRFIDAYNKTDNIEYKLNALRVIEALAQTIRETYPGNYLTGIGNYDLVINTEIFKQVKAQRRILNETLSPSARTIFAIKPPTTVEEMVNGISPEKLKKLMEILSKGINYDVGALQTLYPIPMNEQERRNELPEDREEREMFTSFLNNHAISFLGGGNAQNFKIVNKNSLEEKVLKVEYRLDAPKAAARDLRENALKGKMTKIFAERQATFNHAKHGVTTCSLLVTPLVKGVDLEKYASSLSLDANARAEHTMDLGVQMADIFLAIQQANYAFPDAKTSNWLVDENGKLMIADDKAFTPAQPGGIYSRAYAGNKGYSIISTSFMNPNELGLSSFDVFTMHAYMLGKNLYQIMTNCHSYQLFDNNVRDNKGRSYGWIDLNQKVFETAEGKLIKEIIQKCIVEPASARISLTGARASLAAIPFRLNAPPIQEKAIRLLNMLNKAGEVQNFDSLKASVENAKDMVSLEQVAGVIKNNATVYYKKLVYYEKLIQETNSLLNKGLLLPSSDATHTQQYTQLEQDLRTINYTTQVRHRKVDGDAFIFLSQKKTGLETLTSIVAGVKEKSTVNKPLDVSIIAVERAKEIMQATTFAQIKAITDRAEKDINRVANPGILQRMVNQLVLAFQNLGKLFSSAKAEPVIVEPTHAPPVNNQPPDKSPKPPPKPPPQPPKVGPERAASMQQAMDKVSSSALWDSIDRTKTKVENEAPAMKKSTNSFDSP